MLRITVQDGPDQVRVKLQGNLVGPWVAELEDAWRIAQPARAGRSVSLDLTAVGYVDSTGKYLLALLRCRGAHVMACGTVMTDLVRTIAEDWPLREG
jgi:anti-anti-sigma regulatory factor